MRASYQKRARRVTVAAIHLTPHTPIMRIPLGLLVLSIALISAPAEARRVAHVPEAEVLDVQVRGALTQEQVRASFVAATEVEGFRDCRVASVYRAGGMQWLWLTGTVDARGHVSGLRVLRSDGPSAAPLRCWRRGLGHVTFPTAAATTTFVVEVR